MPIYEYQCKACEKVTDFLQKMSDEPMLTCPECNEDTLKKLISAPRFRLAGSGWYETDFKQGDKRNLVSSDNKKSDTKKTATEANGETTKASETKLPKAESKSETKATTKKDDGKAA